jgi:hypothetical protein
LSARSQDEPAGPPEHRGLQGRTSFKIGKYDVVGQPIPGSMHMLRYTISAGGRRIGTMVSVPSESDCRYLEKPPVVPPLKPFYVTHRPGRPKKGSASPAAAVANDARQSTPALDSSIGVSLPDQHGRDDR